jgi:hypothetical protein
MRLGSSLQESLVVLFSVLKDFASTMAGKRRLTLIVELEEHCRIKYLSADIHRSIESLLHEALTDFLRKHKA